MKPMQKYGNGAPYNDGSSANEYSVDYVANVRNQRNKPKLILAFGRHGIKIDD